MVTAEEMAARAAEVGGSADLRALLAHLRERARPLLERVPPVPEHKARLTTDGGFCPDDGSTLTFDPWSPAEHRCPRCGKTWRGERHDWNWARLQHLWLAERAAHLAALAGIGGVDDRTAAARSRDILNAYGERYWRYPNRDNVLGPSRLFFSTYLESIWTCNYVAAATLLRAADQLDEATTRGVNQVVEEAANLIGDYDEGFSNRQTWNNAALTAVAVWFEDEELAQRAIEGDTGLIAHLVRGYGRDGMWYEGENYHLFALRGLLTGTGWARLAGVDFGDDERLIARMEAALRAPTLTALPDFTYPARKDSRFGMSLAQPAYLELWEVGLGRLGMRDAESEMDDLHAWLRALYGAPAAVPETHESYLHDAPIASGIPRPAARTALSWWSLLEMLPDLPRAEQPWEPKTVLLESQGLGILRSGGGSRYVSVECGPQGGGHGHPDRLQLTVFGDGVHWLPDPGTGSYVSHDLFWYRSTLAHNAPRLDGESQPFGGASLQCFDDQGSWAWVRGRFNGMVRMVASGPEYLVDIVMYSGADERVLELPWHIAGRGSVESNGHWIDAELSDEFVTRVQRFSATAPIMLSHVQDQARLIAHWVFEGELLQMEGPGLPGARERIPFYVVRGAGRNVAFISVIETTRDRPVIRSVQAQGDTVEIVTMSGLHRHRFGTSEWLVECEGQPSIALRGARDETAPFVPLVDTDQPTPVAGPAFRVAESPPLDGSLDGFDVSEPLELGLEDQYRRSEDAYPGPDDLSAVAYAAWDESALYLAVDVTKPDLVLRAANAPPLKLDNEPDEIHSDGLQVYVAAAARAGAEMDGAAPAGYLIVPDPELRTVRVRQTSDTRRPSPVTKVRGEWRRTDTGYRVTVAIPWPAGVHPHAGGKLRFDLIVNEMLPGRTRRVGQLVWSGGGGWVWLRGDRQDATRFGILELVG